MLVLIRLTTNDSVLYNPWGILMGVRGYPDLPNSQTSMTRRFKRAVMLYIRSIPVLIIQYLICQVLNLFMIRTDSLKSQILFLQSVQPPARE